MKKINYLNNKELLSEIHKSKVSYCSYIEDRYANFDTIVENINDITPELIEAVRLKKSTPRGKPAIPLDQLPPEGIVVRVMTYEHIPTDENARKSKIHDVPYSKVPFHPFKHYILENGELKEVCRSHWLGSFSNGHFSANHGNITNKLATMFMMLSEKFSYKGNWRNYSYVDEMRGYSLEHLIKIGLQFNEFKSDNPFAWYTTSINNCFKRVANEEKKNQNIRDDLITMYGYAPSYTRQLENELSSKHSYDSQEIGNLDTKKKD